LLEKHGLVTWGETGEESYNATIEFVARAAQAIEGRRTATFGLGAPPGVEALSDERADALLADALPALRGALGKEGTILESTAAPRRSSFASSRRAPQVSQVGAPLPRHH